MMMIDAVEGKHSSGGRHSAETKHSHAHTTTKKHKKNKKNSYIQATYYQPNGINARYGYPTFYNISGTIHSHTLAWKVDLDVGGSAANSVRLHKIGVETATNWVGEQVVHHKYDVVTPETEDGTAVLMDNAAPASIAVVNEARRNKWGAPRGYKLHVNRVAHQLLPDSFAWSKAMGERFFSLFLFCCCGVFCCVSVVAGGTHRQNQQQKNPTTKPKKRVCQVAVCGDAAKGRRVRRVVDPQPGRPGQSCPAAH